MNVIIILVMFLFGKISLVYAQQLPDVPVSGDVKAEQSLISHENNAHNNNNNINAPSVSFNKDSIKYSTKEFTLWNGNIEVDKTTTTNSTNKVATESVEQKVPVKEVKLTDNNTNTQINIKKDLSEAKRLALDSLKQVSSASNKESSTDTKTQTKKDSEDFLKQEIDVILKADTSIPYDIIPIYYDDKSLSDEQRKQLKNKVKSIIVNSEKSNVVNKLLMVNYKVGKQYDIRLISANKQDNRHIPEPIDISLYEDMAFESVINGDLNSIRALIDNKYISIDIKNKYGTTLLIHATSIGQLDLVRLLLAKGADVNGVNSEGSTALHIAIVKGYYDIAKALVVMGASTSISNYFGSTPLDYAIKKGDSSLINLLILNI
ncbi:MAG: ankyrin repeat domain-containing protein [Rickettsiales endosymbiont of Dermacentor nuttalli]